MGQGRGGGGGEGGDGGLGDGAAVLAVLLPVVDGVEVEGVRLPLRPPLHRLHRPLRHLPKGELRPR